MSFSAKIADYIGKHEMIAPGDRVGVAVSGGADSVALLRALVELRGGLGCVLSAVHFNHKIRVESDAEEKFVEGLAQEMGLEFFGSSEDTRNFAAEHHVSLETAARELRYGYFSTLTLDKIATAHTLDDQAETVLMKMLRGAGTRGLSGIWPCLRMREAAGGRKEKQQSAFKDQHSEKQNRYQRRTAEGGCATQIIRPMLGVRRKEIEAYLRMLGQEWREDASNRDLKHTRNKVRHELLPLLESEFNPNIYQQLADAAEVARAEEEFWGQHLEKQHSAISSQQSGKQVPRPPRRARDDNSIKLEHPLEAPLALRRRLVRAAFEQASGKALDFDHTDALVRFLERRGSSLLQLPERWFAVLDWPKRMLRFEEREQVRKVGTAAGGKTSKKRGAGSRR